MTVYRLLTAGTIEEKIYHRLVLLLFEAFRQEALTWAGGVCFAVC